MSSGMIGITTESGKVPWLKHWGNTRASVICTSTLWSVITILYTRYYVSEDYICHVDRDLLEFAESHYATSPELVCVKSQTFAKQIMQSYQLQEPSTWKDALHSFLF